MYKRASRAMIHATRVNAPLPTGGYIGSVAKVEDDFIPTAANMSLEECEAEARQLGLEITRAQADLAAIKAINAKADQVAAMGLKIQVLVQRKSLINARLRDLKLNRREQRLGDAVKAYCAPSLAAAIFAYANSDTNELPASVDTHPKGGDRRAPAPLSSAVRDSADAQSSSAPAPYGQTPTAQVIGDSLCGKAENK